MSISQFSRFVDHDMFMRFRGGGVGHRATRERTDPISQEADTTIPDENKDNFEADSLGDGEQLEEDESSSESEVKIRNAKEVKKRQ